MWMKCEIDERMKMKESEWESKMGHQNAIVRKGKYSNGWINECMNEWEMDERMN